MARGGGKAVQNVTEETNSSSSSAAQTLNSHLGQRGNKGIGSEIKKVVSKCEGAKKSLSILNRGEDVDQHLQ